MSAKSDSRLGDLVVGLRSAKRKSHAVSVRSPPTIPDPDAGASRRRDHLSFKGNLRQSRYGWLRLTPAYSVHLVRQLLDEHAGAGAAVLDPFCGTGTTALVCAERGVPCDTTDINPFLLWLAAAKARAYDGEERDALRRGAARVEAAVSEPSAGGGAWTPPLHRIEKWWDEETLGALARARAAIEALRGALPAAAVDLLLIAFCRAMIDQANVSFGHQSMSFRRVAAGAAEARPAAGSSVAESWRRAVDRVHEDAASPVQRPPRPLLCDARRLTAALPPGRYSCVITSPPYPNRMSYIRELRPYMYWLGYLRDGRAAGELDWQAIGGTWGCATSNVARWEAPPGAAVPYPGFEELLRRIAEQGAQSGPLLARYVHKYFHDMAAHCASLFEVTRPGATIHYVVGNSKFYDVLLPVEEIFAALFEHAGFRGARVRAIRKRTSKKELFEFVVSATRPAPPGAAPGAPPL